MNFECPICMVEFVHEWQLGSFGCCAGKICRGCMKRIDTCPHCRAVIPTREEPESEEICEVCGDPDCYEYVNGLWYCPDHTPIMLFVTMEFRLHPDLEIEYGMKHENRGKWIDSKYLNKYRAFIEEEPEGIEVLLRFHDMDGDYSFTMVTNYLHIDRLSKKVDDIDEFYQELLGKYYLINSEFVNPIQDFLL